MSYGPILPTATAKSATMSGGFSMAEPAELPGVAIDEIQFVVNLNTAKASDDVPGPADSPSPTR